MSPGGRVAVMDGVMARQVGEQTVILDLGSGTYFGLDAVGTLAWRMIEEGRSFEEICVAIVDAFEATRDEVERDLADLVHSLEEKKLVRLQGD